MTTKSPLSQPEFSRPLAVEKISASGTIKSLEANAEERQFLAARFSLLQIKDLRAELNIDLARGGYVVTGQLVADVVQKCVVTLEPLPAHVKSDIDVLYMAEAPKEDLTGPLDPDEIEVETVTDGVIDLGELVAQTLGIALDPYPRKPGVAFDAPAKEGPLAGPLSKLAELKKKK